MPGPENNSRWPSITLFGRLRVVEKCIRTLLVTTASLWLVTWAYLGRYRPIQPQLASGMIYPLPFHGWTIYVRHFEYILAGPPTWYVEGAMTVALLTTWAFAIIRSRSSKHRKC
jgi:hypothetical protein